MAIKWGILSTADINRKLLAGAAESDDVEVVAVGSRDLARAEEFAQRWEIPRAYGTYDELLADPEVEAIYNPLPNTMHAEWSIRALEAGKHVLCEKPFSRHVEDVERSFAAAEAAGKVLSEAFMYRYHPQTARVVELVRSGAIGELRVIRSAFSYSLFDTSNIRLRTDVEGGALMDVGCYCVSGARLLAGGEPESVAGAAYTGPSGTDWVFTGMLRFPHDVVALLDCGTSLPDRDELEAIGTEGSIFLDDPWHCDDAVIEVRRTVVGEDGEERIEVEEIEVESADPYRLELEAMNAAIRGDAGAALGRADAIGQVRAIDALFRAASSGESVVL